MPTSRRALTRLLTASAVLGASAALGACRSGTTAPEQATGTAARTRDDRSGSPLTGQVHVLAAASLHACFEELATAFTAANPQVSVTFDFQGSQDLVSALAEGADGDVLATADTATMDTAVSQDLVEAPVEFATNVLTLVVPAGNPGRVTGTQESLERADVVVCAPQVPCGAATQELADALGLTLDPASEEQKVTDVLGKVTSGEADAGLVYATDAAGAGAAVEVITLPDNDVVNHYPIARTRTARDPEAAQAWISHVLSDAGQQLLQGTYGFGAPTAP